MLLGETAYAVRSKRHGVKHTQMIPENTKAPFTGALFLNQRCD